MQPGPRSMARMKRFLVVTALWLSVANAWGWGGEGHRAATGITLGMLQGRAARMFTPLRARLVGIHDVFDERADGDREERVRHFLDLEALGEPLPDVTRPAPRVDPRRHVALFEALSSADFSHRRNPGTLPASTETAYAALVTALRANDPDAIVRAATDLLHYVQDAHQPLHATDFYDGIAPFQRGVHAAFETELIHACKSALPRPVKPVTTEERPALLMMRALVESHAAASTVLARDLGCARTCKRVPETRVSSGLTCAADAELARSRLELAAARGASLLARAVAELDHHPAKLAE